MQTGHDRNPRIMYGVIITVYVDRQTSTVRSFQARHKNEGERFIERTWKREIGKTRVYDRRANLLAYIRQMKAESLAGGESDNKPERPNPKKKKRRWIRKIMSKFRLPFRRKNNNTWRYRHLVPDEDEGEANNNSDLWNKLKHMVGGLSRGCLRCPRDS